MTKANRALYRISPEVAAQRVAAFGDRFGQAHLYLAYHAALPLALTPDLLYRLWANFQQDVNGEALNIPWIAVSDLLLSKICEEVGHELYEMHIAIRNELLHQLKANSRFGKERVNQLSSFLLTYVQQQLGSHAPDIRDFAQAQKWTALAYTQPNKLAHEIAATLSVLKLEDKPELLRIASLVETFAEPLAGFEPLLFYMRGMAKFVRNDLDSARIQFDKLPAQQQIRLAGISLDIPFVRANISIYNRDVFILIDNSASMAISDITTDDLTRWNYVQSSVEALIFHLLEPIKDQRICEQVYTCFFSRNKTKEPYIIKDISAIDNLFLENPPFGSTFIGPTLERCLDIWLEGGKKEGRGAFYFIYTDGMFDDEQRFMACIKRAASQITDDRVVKFFVIGVGDDINIERFIALSLNVDKELSSDIFVFDLANRIDDFLELMERQVVLDERNTKLPEWFVREYPDEFRRITSLIVSD